MRVKKVLGITLAGCMLVTGLPGGMTSTEKAFAAENGSCKMVL